MNRGGGRASRNATAAVVAQARNALLSGRSAGFRYVGKATAQEAEAGQMLIQPGIKTIHRVGFPS